MIKGLYTSASGMTTQMKKQDTIANNIANVNTTGFKKSETIMTQGKEFEIYRKEDGLDKVSPNPKTKMTKIGKLGTGVKMAENFVSHGQGSLKETENNLDFALEGKGLFVFDTKNGLRYGRNGSLSVNNEGVLVNGNGDKLVAYDFQGNLGFVKPNDPNFSIGSDGSLIGVEIVSDIPFKANTNGIALNLENVQNPKNSVLVCEFEDLKDLQLEGDTYFYSNSQNNLTPSVATSIHQGYLENSDVSVVKEMVEMINCSRLYESNQKVLTSLDETIAKSNELNKWT